MTASALPRRVALWDTRPPVVVVGISGHRPCRWCGFEVAYFADRSQINSAYAHTASGRVRCDTEAFNVAEPKPACRDCGSADVAWAEEAWGNAKDCRACGRHDFYPIGD